MKLENENLGEPQKPQLNIGAVSGSLQSINIDKVPIYLKDLFDYCRSKNIEIDDEQVIKKLWYEYDVECYLSRGNDR
jgi:hypothetical protein